ncbi:LUC7 [Candida oxycetoniae]|uniref:LUC7 n=1 Tax=Candida oxycetoniae TaxID=497107 RepID=A0AAI9STA4_9ASCO|nr:LUC7 [Candida oxycetoniae]KAI3402652.2 LUC7 [Candida oxycetoniae]
MGKQSSSSYVRHYNDPGMTAPEVCKAFVIGICPHDLFVGTKSDLGNCPNLHIHKYKLEYEYKTKKLGKKYPEMEYEYFQMLQSYIHDLDRNIAIAQKRLEHTPEEKQKISKVTADLDNLDVEIGLMIQELNYLMAISSARDGVSGSGHSDQSLKIIDDVSGSSHSDQSLKIIDLSIKLNDKCKERDEASKQARNIIDNVVKKRFKGKSRESSTEISLKTLFLV